MAYQPDLIFKKRRSETGDGERVRKDRLSGAWCIGKGILCTIGVLFLLLTVSSAAWPQKPADKGALLADRHKEMKIECAQCHQGNPSAPVATPVCAGCHPNVAKGEKIRENLANPHNAHMSYPECADCHHVHKASENQCAGCHNFDYKMR